MRRYLRDRARGVALVVLTVALVVSWGVSGALAAGGAPAWSVQSVAQPTSFSAFDNGNLQCEERPRPPHYQYCDRYTLVVTNIGTRASNGIITVTDTLPEGITTSHPPQGVNETESFEWACETEEGGPREVVRCTAEPSVAALSAAPTIEIPVTVSAGIAAGSIAESEVTVAGGEAAEVKGVASTPIASSLEPAPGQPFAVLGFGLSAVDQAGLVDTRAGGHPGAFTSSFYFPSVDSFNAFRHNKGNEPPISRAPYPVEDIKQLVTDLPPGVVGDALAAPTCLLSALTSLTRAETQCPSASHVGSLVLIETGSTETELVIFNVTPEHGHAAEFAVFLPSLQRAVLLYATLVGTGAGAHVRVVSAPQPNILPVVGVSLTVFGDPAVIDGAPLTPVAFATNPSDCTASGFTTSMYVDTWQHSGRLLADGEPDLSDPNWKKATSTQPPVTGCEQLHFDPSLTFAPEPGHSGPDEPAGYESVLRVPQSENASGLATPPLKTAVATLPAGVAISPSAANGLLGCQETGPEGIELQSNQPGHCPAASTVGQVELTTPLLKETLKGSVFVAQPTCGGEGQPQCTEEAAETGGVFALYVEVGSENTGIHLKVGGKVEVGGNGHHNNLAPGQVRTTFPETPQDPFSELKLTFKNGPGAPLANPQTCGVFAAESSLTPWSSTTQAPTQPSLPFTISGCENSFSPSFSAGTTNPQAGAYSPFTLTLSRHDREGDLAGITVNMPEGLLAKIAGITQCPEAQANAGTCPPASRIGTATAAAGSGTRPYWQSGAVYLTGPYAGAPFGLSVVVPAKAGPYNLGNIVARARIKIDPHTAQATVLSDPLPQSVDGVPLRVQTVNVTVGENTSFTLNPTSCEPAQITATITATAGASANVQSRYQAANCANLKFAPTLTASTQAKTGKANGASLHVNYTEPAGQSNTAKAKIQLPKLLPSRNSTLQKACLEHQFQANPAGCPEGSIIGTATVHTPLLNNPLAGPVYLVAHGGAQFPTAVFLLQGENVQIIVEAATDIKHGITTSTFEHIPDAPFSLEVTLPEGPHSIFTTYNPGITNLCTPTLPIKVKKHLTIHRHGHTKHITRTITQQHPEKLQMPTTLTGQNGTTFTQNTKINVTGCPKPNPKKHNTNQHTHH